MAMIECPECKKEVSSKALQCPSCACPIAAGSGAVAVDPAAAQTVELTSKRLKIQVLLSVLMILSCLVLVFVGAGTDSSGTAAVGGIGTGIGFVWFIVTRIRIWWHHK